MAEPHTLQVGDAVTHPQWPAGTTRKVVDISHFMRMGWSGKRRRLEPDPDVRIIHLNDVVEVDGEGDDAWMEAGLERIERPQ